MAEKSTNKNTDKLYKALLSPKKALRVIINDMGGGIDDSTPYADYVTKYNGHKISAYVINAVNNMGTTLTATIATKVDKTSSANKVYGTNGSGVQVTIDVDNYPNAEGSIARRSAQAGHVGQIQVPVTPIANGEASSKQYVDKSTAKSLVVSMDNSTYVITFTLKDGNNNTLSTQSVDLPLESTVVSGSYDDDTQSLVLTLKSGSTIAIPIDDLIDGLISSTDLSTTLANYYTKTEADNEFVDKTSTETITGEKTFEGDLKFKGSGSSTVGQITTASNSVKIGYGGVNHVSIDGGNFHTNVADYDLGSSSKKWRDVYVSRNLTDGTNAITVANILAKADKTYVDTQDNAILYALNNLRSMFYETTVDVETMLENYLSFKALPLTLSSKNIIFSAGMDLLNIKGNSFVYNQQVQNGNFTSNTGWEPAYLQYVSCSIASNKATVSVIDNTGGSAYNYGIITSVLPSIIGHKYLIHASCKSSTFNTFLVDDYGGGGVLDSNGFVLWTCNSAQQYLLIKPRIADITLNIGDTYTVENIQLIDLTQSGITASDVAEAKAELLKRGVNVDEYNPYNVGQIRNSQPTLFRSNPFNLFDGEVQIGTYSNSTGAYDSAATDRLCCKNPIEVAPNQTLYFKTTTGLTAGNVCFYDKNDSFISSTTDKGNSTFTTPSTCKYIRISFGLPYGTTYKNDICINISNASLNGTYKPYVEPDEKTLTIPVLRSAGTVQDDCENVKTINLDLSQQTWNLYDSEGVWYTDIISGVKPAVDNSATANLISSKYTKTSRNNIVNKVELNTIAVSSSGSLLVYNGDGVNSPTGEANFERTTPTPQSPAITLPQDIKVYSGGSIEVEYDSTNSCPSDFEFEVATSKIVEE